MKTGYAFFFLSVSYPCTVSEAVMIFSYLRRKGVGAGFSEVGNGSVELLQDLLMSEKMTRNHI